MSETLIKVESVSKKFCRNLKRSLWYGLQDLGNELLGRLHGGGGNLRKEEFWAVKDVSFELKRGECLGIIGHNGAGKTTLLRMLNGLIKPDHGYIELRGRVGALIALGAGFNPVLTGRENIYVNAAVLGFAKSEIDRKFSDIVEFAGIGEFIDSPVQHYSSGMRVRLGFSVAANFSPDILLIDEALAVGDVAFTVRCLNRIADLRKEGAGIVFVSHNELQVRGAAQRCILMNKGRASYHDTAAQAFLAYESEQAETSMGNKTGAGFVHDGPVRMMAVFPGLRETENGFHAGDDILLQLNCEAEMPCDDLELDLRLWSSSGQLVTIIRSGAYRPNFDLPQGKSKIRADIRSISLAPGYYRLAGGFWRDGEVLGWSRDLAHIRINPSRDTSWIGEGLLTLRATFHGPET